MYVYLVETSSLQCNPQTLRIQTADLSSIHLQFISNFCRYIYLGCFSLGGLNPELYKTKAELEDDDGTEYPENHVGRVWFGLEYDTASERLIVALIKARNLPESRTTGSSCNSFVRVALFPDERRTLQSKPKKNTKNPHFNETFGFQVSKSIIVQRDASSSAFFIMILFTYVFLLCSPF